MTTENGDPPGARPASTMAALAPPLRWIGNGAWAFAAFAAVIVAILVATGEAELELGVFLGPLVLIALGWLCRYAAKRLARGDGPPLETVGSWVFIVAGAAMVAGGIVVAIDDPGGIALIAFGLVFVGAGYLVRRLFGPRAGEREIAVAGYAAEIRSYDGRQGTRRQAATIRVDADAGPAEAAAARRAWTESRLALRPDWIAGRIQPDEKRLGTFAYWGAGIWTVLTLGAFVAALIWGDIYELVTIGFALTAATFIAGAVRIWLVRRKYGDSLFHMTPCPVELGGRLEGEVETGVAKSVQLAAGFRVALRCVHRWEETVGTGSDRRSVRRRNVLWQDETHSPGRVTALSRTYAVPIRYLGLPTDRPPSSLGGVSDGIFWELAVSAELPGIDYQATFTLPVLAPGSLAPS